MRIECNVQGVLDNLERLPWSVGQEMVFVRDATGREYKLLGDQCRSHKVSRAHQI